MGNNLSKRVTNPMERFFSRTTHNELLRPSLISLVNGYCLANYNKYIPTEIIQICIEYFLILDEFDSNTCTAAAITGVNNTISLITTDNAFVTGRNIICEYGKYHWELKIASTDTCCIEVGLINKKKAAMTITAQPCHDAVGSIRQHTFDIYLNFENNQTRFGFVIAPFINVENKIFETGKHKEYRVYVKATGGIAKIELLAYCNSNWFTKGLEINDPIAYIKYAKCLHNECIEKIKYYETALKFAPNVERFHNEYILYLIDIAEYDKAFNHALCSKKGSKGISRLFRYYYNRDDQKAFELLKLLNIEQLKDDDYCEYAAYCNQKFGAITNAMECYDLYIKQHNDDPDKQIAENVFSCIVELFRIYHLLGDNQKALLLLQRLDDAQIKKMKYPQVYLQISKVYEALKDYKKQRLYLQKCQEMGAKDFKGEICIDLSVIAYKQNNVEQAIKHCLNGLQSANLDRNSIHYFILNANLGKFYCKMDRYDDSMKYLMEAIKIDADEPHINGYYGITLYCLKQFDEAISCLTKCVLYDDPLSDDELLFDSLFVYGNILYHKKQFKQSIEQCKRARNHNGFYKYKDKEKIHNLLKKNMQKIENSNCNNLQIMK